MDNSHATAFENVKLGAERRGRHQGENAHAVHVVGNRFAVRDAKTAPSCALGRLEALEEVEERNGRVGVFGIAGFDIGQDCEQVSVRHEDKGTSRKRVSHTDEPLLVVHDIPLSTVHCSFCTSFGSSLSALRSAPLVWVDPSMVMMSVWQPTKLED